MLFSAQTDPELRDWLRWATESGYVSGEVPIFVKMVAEAASIADLENYALLRPVLLKLQERNPHTTRNT